MLRQVGEHLGRLAGRDLADRCRRGREGDGRTPRKRTLTSSSSSRWAGAVTRTSNDQWSRAYRNLVDQRMSLRRAIGVIEARLSAPAGGRTGRIRGYASPQERFAKQQRLQRLVARLAVVEARLGEGRRVVVPVGCVFARLRHHLDEAGLAPAQWEERWHASRLFLYADGEADKRWGNETIRVHPEVGWVEIRLPSPLRHLSNTPGRAATLPPVGSGALLLPGRRWACRPPPGRSATTSSSTPPSVAGTSTPPGRRRRGSRRPSWTSARLGARRGSQRRAPRRLRPRHLRQPPREAAHRHPRPHRSVLPTGRAAARCHQRPVGHRYRVRMCRHRHREPRFRRRRRHRPGDVGARPGGADRSAAPWPASPPAGSATGLWPWPPTGACPSSPSTLPTPAAGRPSTGRAPSKPRPRPWLPSPATTRRRWSSDGAAKATAPGDAQVTRPDQRIGKGELPGRPHTGHAAARNPGPRPADAPSLKRPKTPPAKRTTPRNQATQDRSGPPVNAPSATAADGR